MNIIIFLINITHNEQHNKKNKNRATDNIIEGKSTF